MRGRWDLVPPITTLLVGALLVAGTRAVWPSPGCGPEQVTSESTAEGGANVVRVVVVSSSNKGALMAEMACRFELTSPTVDGNPVDVVIVSEPSGAGIEKISSGSLKPDVWAPASSSWLSMLRVDYVSWVPAGPAPSIMQSPQVIAMPAPMAESLGWPDAQIGWSDILDWATVPGLWSRTADPQWGDFKLGKTNPRFSTSGLNATAATFQAATGRLSDLTLEDLAEPGHLDFVRGVESAVVHYAPTSLEFLQNLRQQDDRGEGEGYVSAVLLEEKSVWDYNQGNPSGNPATLGQLPPPQTPLAAFYPSDGAIMADHPYVVLTAGWVTEADRKGAEAFLRFLEAPAQQRRFQALGFRDRTGAPGPEINERNGLIPRAPEEIAPPGGDVMKQIRNQWSEYRKRARVLILMDVSGSMNSIVPDTGQTKLELAKAAALGALDELGPDDEVGLWTFSPPSSSGGHVENVPVGRLSSNEDELRSAIAGLRAEGGTQLYTTLEAAVHSMRSKFDEEEINGIILLSDGVNEDPLNDDRSGVIQAVAPTDPDTPIRVFTIAYGDLADVQTLAQIAKSSLGTAYDATDATTIERIFDRVVANF